MAIDSDSEPARGGVGKSKAAAIAGTAVGTGAGFGLFTLINFGDIAKNSAGSNIGYFYPLAIFSALSLLSIVIYSQRNDAPPWREQRLSMIGMSLFGFGFVLALGIISYLLVYPVAHCGGAACTTKLNVAARFDDYSDAGSSFSFSQDGLPTGPLVQLVPSIEGDGRSHNFDSSGNIQPVFGFDQSPANLTVYLKNLAILKNSYGTLMKNYVGLKQSQDKLAVNCKDVATGNGAQKLAAACFQQLEGIVYSSTLNQ